ncbi:MAG: ATP synthase F1 subunit delta [Bacteroidales bacterium]
MNEARIAARYSRALFSLATDRGLDEEVRSDLAKLIRLRKESAEFRLLLGTPVLRSSEKIRMLNKALTGTVSNLTLDFIALLIGHHRELCLESVVRMYNHLLKSSHGILEARILTAGPVKEELVEEITGRLAKHAGARIEMSHEIREELIGGFILQLEDQQLDASVLAQLKQIRNEWREAQK